MSPELVAILAVGALLAGLILQGQSSLGKRMDRLEGRMDRLEGRMDGLDKRLRAVEIGLAETRGQLAIIRDYITGRNTRQDDAAE